MRTARGFTLVELLIVVGVIALLIGILIPAVAKAREYSRRVGCLANLHAFATALYTYAENYSDHLPNGNPPGVWTDSAGATQVLVDFAAIYMPTPISFHCPTDTDPVPMAITTADYSVPDSARVSYEFYSVWWAPEFGPTVRQLDGRAPLMWDLDSAANTSPIKNHQGGGNVLYADGHADWQGVKDWEDANWPSPANEYYPIP